MNIDGVSFRTVWMEGPVVRMIDQPRLPHAFVVADMRTHLDTARAISTMVVRGAGAIGATGAYGVAQAALEAPDQTFHAYLARAADTLRATRPTAGVRARSWPLRRAGGLRRVAHVAPH